MSDDLAGINKPGTVYRNLSVPTLIETSLARREGLLSETGALVTNTGERTGRSPKDRWIVRHGESEKRIEWGGPNKGFTPEAFDALFERVRDHLSGKDLFVVDGILGADPKHQIRLRVITEFAWHALFVRQLFRRPERADLESWDPEFVQVAAPTFAADPDRDGTNSDAFVGLDLERKQVLICGTHYAGEMKKSLFTSANYLFPMQGVLPMHCSANVDASGSVALFFGLSGTGKTTLSADPERRLIGDDEHGWTDDGVFNFEGGCYAKCIGLTEANEPQIWSALRFGAVVENVVVDQDSRAVDYDDDSITENTRAAYPLEFIPGYVPEGRAGQAETIVFLTADATGVLPPIARLSAEGAMYHFLSGFTSKLAGTEAGMGSEPEATFSTCFGSPFLPLPPSTYAEMLGERIARHGVAVYLVNTGWTGGPVGVGKRMALPLTRQLVKAATSGRLEGAEYRQDPIFNLDVPTACPGVPGEVLDPKSTWDDPVAYDAKARELAQMFVKNFARFEASVSDEVVKAGPAGY